MKLLSLFSSSPPPPRILGSDSFGPPMTLTEVKAGFAGMKDSPIVRALGQVALAMREECVAHSNKSLASEMPLQGAMHAGGGDACAEFALIVADLAEGRVGDDVKKWFVDAAKASS